MTIVRRVASPLLASLLVLATAGCIEPDPVGDWGGGGVSLTLTRAGGKLNLGCGARVTIDSGWSSNWSGKLTGSGLAHPSRTFAEPLGGAPMQVHLTGTIDLAAIPPIVTHPDSGLEVRLPWRDVLHLTVSQLGGPPSNDVITLYRDSVPSFGVCFH